MRHLALVLAAALLPLATVATAAETEHVVSQGETLNGIANRAGVTGKAVADANGLKPPFALRLGQKLKIPRVAAAKLPTAKAGREKAAPPKAALLSVPRRATVAATSPAKPADNPALVKESVHLVGEGETLGGIANRAKVPRILIAEANGLTEPYDVRPGQKLLIPRTRHYVVKPGDTGFDISYRHAVPWSQIAIANGLDPKAPVTVGKELLIPTVFDPQLPAQPSKAATAAAVKTAAAASAVATAAVAAAKGPVTRTAPRFAWPLTGSVRRGWKSTALADHHDGLDIAAPKGAPVRAASAGTVVFAGNEKEQFGNLVVLDHGDGWNSAYGFLSKVTVKIGDKVASGERVGLVGATGQARGNELHFEVRRNGVAVDPAPELPKAL